MPAGASLDWQSRGHTEQHTRFHCSLPGLQLEQEIVIISTKALSKLGSPGNNGQRDYLTRRVKNTDKLGTVTAVVPDSREAATAHVLCGKRGLQFTCEA